MSAEKRREILEYICLACSLTVVIVLFGLPILLFFVQLTLFSESSNVTSLVNNSDMSFQSEIGSCAYPLDRTPVQCTAVVYNGELCKEQLQAAQMCSGLGFSSSPIMVNATNKNTTALLLAFESVLQLSQGCEDAIRAFLCQYTFPLCDNASGYLYQTSQEHCVHVREEVCSVEWNTLNASGFGNELPNCNQQNVASLTNAVETNVTCLDSFININNTCQPRCDSWRQYRIAFVAIEVLSRYICGICGVIGGSILLVISIIRYDQMFTFPSVLLVYIIIGLVIMTFFILVAEVGSTTLLCSSVTVMESRANPSLLCTISGAVLHYGLISMTLFSFFHILMIFYKVVFPLYAFSHRKKEKYLHLPMAILGFVLPLPAVIAALANDEFKYIVVTFPPSVCVTQSQDLFFYSIFLALDVLLAAITCLIITVFWSLRKNQRKQERAELLSTPEKKLLFVLSYYLVFGIIMLIYLVTFAARGAGADAAVADYFACEAPGHVPGKCDGELENVFDYFSGYWWLASVSFLLAGFVPVIFLTFVVDVKSIRQKISIFRSFCHKLKLKAKKDQSSIPLAKQKKEQPPIPHYQSEQQ